MRPDRPSPTRVLIETFDFLELYCGAESPLTAAMEQQGMRVGPRIDIRIHPAWDVTEFRIFEWLAF